MDLLRSILGVVCVGFAASVSAQPYTTTVEQGRLIGQGMSPELSRELTNFMGGDGIFQPVVPRYVPTMAATPAAATNKFQPGLNVVPTAAANTAAFLGDATPVPGQHFVINNSMANAVRIKAAGGATLNGATAGGYIALPALATVDCYTASATNQVCMQPVIPTPAGP